MRSNGHTRYLTPQEAVAPIRSGQHVLVGSGASEPQALVEALAKRGEELFDTEIVHLLTLGTAPYAEARFEGRLRHNALFIGPNVRGAVAKGLADYTPCFLSEVPNLIRSGRLPVDVALIQATPPQAGVCSLGVAVDIIKAAVEAADYVVVQANPKMPWTLGDSFLRSADIDAFVRSNEPLLTLPPPKLGPDATAIAKYVARLVNDGDTIQAGIGAIPDAVLAALSGKKDLGIHSEMISDGVLDLWRSGAVTGLRKTTLPGKIVTSFCMGTQALYEAVDRNPAFEFHPSDFVNDPAVIAANDRMVSINSALQVDLTGQVCADSIGPRFYSGVGGQVDFIRGAARSKGGRSVIALPSTAKGGTVSRIAPVLTEGAGVVTTRADVDFIVTEFGIASLKGRTIRERALGLIQIAHPNHRPMLIAEAQRLGYIEASHVVPSPAQGYPIELEATAHFGDLEVFFRPIRPQDERRLKDLFYSQSQDTTNSRFGAALKRLTERQFQDLVAIDYDKRMAIAGFVREGGRQRMVAVARYFKEPDGSWAEAAFTVHDKHQGRGIGKFMVRYLAWIARERGLEGFTAQVLRGNSAMLGAFKATFRAIEERLGDEEVDLKLRFADADLKENPALEASHA